MLSNPNWQVDKDQIKSNFDTAIGQNHVYTAMHIETFMEWKIYEVYKTIRTIAFVSQIAATLLANMHFYQTPWFDERYMNPHENKNLSNRTQEQLQAYCLLYRRM